MVFDEPQSFVHDFFGHGFVVFEPYRVVIVEMQFDLFVECDFCTYAGEG